MPRSLIAAAVLLTLIGCAHRAPAARKPVAEFEYKPEAGGSMIVLYRNTAGFMGGGAMVNATLSVDGKALGDLGQDRFAVISVAPGEHMVNLLGASGVSNLIVTPAAGEMRFIQVSTYPTLTTEQKERSDALLELDNEGEPLRLGFKYSFTDKAAPAPGAPSTTHL